MSYYSPSIEKLIEAFEKLPSIGNKTAARLAFHILDASEEETNEFITAIQDAKKNLKYCSQCFNITDTDPCPICGNQNRDHSVIFEIASKYCISDSLVDHDGYSISSERFLPAVVDIMVI